MVSKFVVVTDRDGHFVSASLGSELVTPSKDGKIKGHDAKKVHLSDGKTAKVEGKEPVLLEPGNRLVLSEYSLWSLHFC